MFNLTIINLYFLALLQYFFSKFYFLLPTNVLLFQEIVMSIAWQIKAIHYFFEKCIGNTTTLLKNVLHYSIGNTSIALL